MAIINTVGIDGSLTNFGFAVCSIDTVSASIVEVKDLILSETSKDNTKGVSRSADDLSRFQQHWQILTRAIDKYDVKVAFGEVPQGGQDNRSCFTFGGITALLACLPVPLVQLSPLQVKEGSVGVRYADKEDIIEWAYKTYPDANWFTSKRANNMNIKSADGLFLMKKNEHLADSIAAVKAGLKYKKIPIEL